MAIALDTSATVNTNASSATITVNITAGGSTTLVTGTISGYTTLPVTSGVTWNGAAMTAGPSAAATVAEDVSMWYKSSPATGAHALVASFSPDTPYGAVVTAASWTGTATSSPVNNTNTGASLTKSSPGNLSITCASGAVALDVQTLGSAITMTPGSGQTSLYSAAWGGAEASTSYKVDATSMEWTWSGTQRWAAAVMEILPASGGGGFQAAWARNSNIVITPGGSQ